MTFVLSSSSCIGTKGFTLQNLKQIRQYKRGRNLKFVSTSTKIVAAQRKKLIQEGYLYKNQDKKSLEIRVLNTNLKNCRDSIELFQLMQKNQEIMDAIHVSTAAVAAGRLISSKKSNATELKTMHAIYILLNVLILQHVRKMNSQSVANCLWSYGKTIEYNNNNNSDNNDNIPNITNKDYKVVFEKLCQRAMIISKGMKTQAASNILWALAKFQQNNNNKLIHQIVKQAIISSKEEFDPQALCNILWAMATLKFEDQKAVKHFVELSKTCVNEMTGQGVSNLMWALQQLRYYDQELILIIEDNIINNKNIVFDPQNISNMMLAFTDFGLYNKQKISEILVDKFLSMKHFTMQAWSIFLYALAVLDCPLSLAQKVVDQVLPYQNQSQQISNLEIIRLIHLQLAQVFYNVRGKKLLIPKNLEQKCKIELQVYMRSNQQIQNSFTDTIFEVVKSHFEFAQKNVLTYDDQIDVDICVQAEEKNKVAVEACTTNSYFNNCRKKLLGRSQHQVFLLEQLGWQIVEVSAFKWNNSSYRESVIAEIEKKLT